MRDKIKRIIDCIRKHPNFSTLSDGEPEEALPCAAALIEKLSEENKKLKALIMDANAQHQIACCENADYDCIALKEARAARDRYKALYEAALADIHGALSEGAMGCDLCAFFKTPDDCRCNSLPHSPYCNPKWRGMSSEK